MPINLLGKKDEDGKKTEVPIEMYIPESEKVQKNKPVKKPVEVPVETKQKVEEVSLPSVDLSDEFLRRQRLIKGLIISAVSLVVVGIFAGGVYWYQGRPIQPTTVIPPQNEPITAPTPEPTPVQPIVTPTPTPTPEPTPPVTNQPVSVQDTPLAPLRGSLITFANSTEIFLIENNGELRLVDQAMVIFKNGQTMNQLNRNLIYRLPDKWKVIRRGLGVTGQVDFDPRVLSTGELLPFLQ